MSDEEIKVALRRMDESMWQAWKAFSEEGPDAAEKFIRAVCIDEGIMTEDGGRIPRGTTAQPISKERILCCFPLEAKCPKAVDDGNGYWHCTFDRLCKFAEKVEAAEEPVSP